MKSLIVLIGHRARQGKDTLAELLSKYVEAKYPKEINVHTVHWADALKEEIEYNTDYPLIVKSALYFLLRKNLKGDYYTVKTSDVPEIEKFMEGKGLIYYGMKEKDPEILQWWGTNFRREQDEDYWVRKGNNTIKKLIKSSNKPTIIFVPDTRFFNEAEYKLSADSVIYIEVQRFKNGLRYYTADRDPDHESESQLDDFESLSLENKYQLRASDGDLTFLKESGIFIIEPFIESLLKENK